MIVIDHNSICVIYLFSLSFSFIENLEGAFNSCSVGGASFIPRVGAICLGLNSSTSEQLEKIPWNSFLVESILAAM